MNTSAPPSLDEVEVFRGVSFIDATFFRAKGPLGRYFWSVVATLWGALLVWGCMKLYWQAAVVLGLTGVAAAPNEVRLGLDGIEDRWPLSRTFYPHASILDMRRTERGLWLVLAGAAPVMLQTAEPERLESLWRSLVAREVGADVARARLARGERTDRQWLAMLGAAVSATGDAYRGSQLRAEELWQLLRAPRSSQETKVAAAMALRNRIDDDGRANLRRAAAAYASNELACAVERASDPSLTDEELEESLRFLVTART